jgi:hypothetical protein
MKEDNRNNKTSTSSYRGNTNNVSRNNESGRSVGERSNRNNNKKLSKVNFVGKNTKYNPKSTAIEKRKNLGPIDISIERPAPVKNRREVIFDENARTEWLTGFGKRKQQRRQYGHAMQIMKDKKSHREMVREKRDAMKDYQNVTKDNNKEDNNNDDDNDDDDNNNNIDSSTKESVFEDEQTMAMFGGSVEVVVGTGVADDLNEHSYPLNDNNVDDSDSDSGSIMGDGTGKRNKYKKELTRLERALKEVKVKNLLQKKVNQSFYLFLNIFIFIYLYIYI